MIDLDLQSDMRDKVIEAIRKEYGSDKVLQLSTYTTEGVSSSIQTTCRGLDIDTITGQNISNLADNDVSLRRQIYGDKEDNIKINKRFVDAANNTHKDIIKNALELEELVKGRGSHAGGIVVFNNGYINEGNALMKTTSGTDVTQFNSDDTEFLGGMKIDLLSIDALSRLRTAFDLLLEHNQIKWQGNLRATYNKYLHPDILDFSSGKMYDMLFNGEVINAFQFSSDVGNQALRKVNARSFQDLSITNSLMRLTTKNTEQPIDKYIRFRDNINEWYHEMQQFGLTNDEILVLREHLDDNNGICDTQESLMQLSIDERITGYSLEEANMFRKLVAKANQEELKLEYDRLIKHAKELGNRTKFVDYVYEYCYKPMFGYAFSMPHVIGYTLITLQQMNLCYKYTPLYWQTACLIVDSGGNDGDGGNDYGRISRAASSLHGKVLPPNINMSDLTFTPLPKKESILFGLNPVSGLRRDILSGIMENRPFKSIPDFMKRTGATVNQTEILIKSGAFNDLYQANSRDIMIDFVDKVAVPNRDSLNMTNFVKAYSENIINQEKYHDKYLLYMFRDTVRSNKEPNDNFNKYFLENLSFIKHDYDSNGNIIVDKNELEKYYDSEMDEIRNLLKSRDVVNKYNQLEKREYWIDNCSGSVESWQMETISFYPDKHEFDYIPIEKHFPISNFNQTTSQGVIAGTVIDKDKPKSLIYLSTKDAVVTVKMWRNVYNKYDEVITNKKRGKDRVIYDDSWFKRGTKLVLVGRKSGEQFFLDNRKTRYSSPIYHIDRFNEDMVQLREERYGR